MSELREQIQVILAEMLQQPEYSAPRAKLATALAAVQAELPRVTKDSKADIETKSGGRFGYTYADLAGVSQHILPLLGKHGLAFMCKSTMLDGRMVLMYSLLHSSGEPEDGIYPLPQNATPQQLGSAITYGRRYCLCAVTGVAADEDDHGKAATVAEEKPKAAKSPAARRTSADWQAYEAEKAAAAAADVAQAEPKGDAQLLAELAQKFADDGSTVPMLRAQVYEAAEKANLLTTRVSTPWQADHDVPLSWVISEARKRIEAAGKNPG